MYLEYRYMIMRGLAWCKMNEKWSVHSQYHAKVLGGGGGKVKGLVFSVHVREQCFVTEIYGMYFF